MKIIFRMYSQFYRLAFPHRVKRSRAKWVRENPFGFRIAARKWRQRHSKLFNERKYWYEHNSPGSIAGRKRRKVIRQARRRARQRNAQIGDNAAIRKIYARSQELRKWFDVVVDHKVPLSKGGAHSAENLQIIYAFENIRKGTRLDYIPSIVFH
jgi:5-methylcytosine-specific restriction endonuclease McrA